MYTGAYWKAQLPSAPLEEREILTNVLWGGKFEKGKEKKEKIMQKTENQQKTKGH
jgi:hypothetical protein